MISKRLIKKILKQRKKQYQPTLYLLELIDNNEYSFTMINLKKAIIERIKNCDSDAYCLSLPDGTIYDSKNEKLVMEKRDEYERKNGYIAGTLTLAAY